MRFVKALLLVVDEGSVCDGGAIYELAEQAELFLSVANADPLVIIVTREKRPKVEWHHIELTVSNVTFIRGDILL